MADAHPLPNIAAYAPSDRRCVMPIINDLYRNMAALDYHKRAETFQYVFSKIDQALIVLRNENSWKKWREQSELYRKNLAAKRERARARLAATGTGERL